MIHVEVNFTVAPGDKATAVAALTQEAPQMNALPGNLGVRVLTDPALDGAITLLHQWDDIQNLDNYRSGPLFAKVGGILRPLMTQAPRTSVYDAREVT